MGLAYKWKDTVLGGIVNKSKNNKKMSRVNNNSQGRYVYMTKEDGEKIKDFLDLDDNRSKQIMQDAQVLKKAYLSDEVVSKMKEEINEIFEKEYYSYTNRLFEYKSVLEDYKCYLDGIEDRIRDYEKIALQSNSDLKQYGMVFKQYSEELETYNMALDHYEKKLDEYKINHEADKAIMDDVEKMVNKNMSLDVLISNEVNRVMEQNNRNMKDFIEGEFTKIAARSIKSRKKIDTMFVVLLTSNIITILGLIALYLFK